MVRRRGRGTDIRNHETVHVEGLERLGRTTEVRVLVEPEQADGVAVRDPRVAVYRRTAAVLPAARERDSPDDCVDPLVVLVP